MSFWGGLGKVLGTVGSVAAAPFTGGTSLAWLPAALGAGGAALGAIGQSKAQNRDAQYSGQLDLERLLMARDQQQFNNTLAREQDGRESGSDAWRKLLAAQRTISPGPRPQLSPYSVAPRQATGAEMDGANAMTAEVMARVQGGNPLPMPAQRPMSVDPRLLKPGGMEQAAGWLSPILSFMGQMPARREQPRTIADLISPDQWRAMRG